MDGTDPGPPPARPGVPLKDRPIAEGPPVKPASGGQPRRRHCWVDHPEGSREGLVLQWAQDQGGWVALVIYVVPRSQGDLAVQEWVPAVRLRPAEAGDGSAERP